MGTFKDLDIWKLSIELSLEIYKLTSIFPKEEIYGITSQMRRSATSVPLNVSEGDARKSTKENIHFLHIAFGSLNELETLLILSEKLGYCNSNDYTEKLSIIRMKVAKYIQYLKSRLSKQ